MNHFRMDQTGFSLATLRRHVRPLCEISVIVEAYGFDLVPLAARAQEFEALDAALQSERAECASKPSSA